MTLIHADDWLTLYAGDCRAVMAAMDPESVQCVVTSPPYWGLRDYGVDGQLGLEPTPEAYVAALVAVFREVRRVLRRDGTVWLNLGDSYQNAKGQAGGFDPKQSARRHGLRPMDSSIPGLKPKDRVMIPARVALALQADGWWLRDEIVWHKPNPMPSSVEDRTTPAHEMVYLLTRSARYHYDAAAIREGATYFGPNGAQHSPYGQGFTRRSDKQAAAAAAAAEGSSATRTYAGFNDRWNAAEAERRNPTLGQTPGRNKRSVWTVATEPYPEAHFATFPTALIEPMILAGAPAGSIVLDPFGGSGTVAVVAQRLGRKAVLIDLSPDYCRQAMERVGRGRGRGDGPALDLPIPAPTGSLWDVPA